MARIRFRSVSLPVLFSAGALAICGCATQSPWASRATAAKPVEHAATALETPPASPALPNAPAQTAEADSHSGQMQEVMAELQRLGALDPAARDQLTADLQDTDPALWPGLLHQARAVAAYRQRAAAQQRPPTDSHASGFGEAVSYDGPIAGRPAAPPPSEAGADSRNSTNPSEGISASPSERLPAPAHAALAAPAAPSRRYPSTGVPPVEGMAARHGVAEMDPAPSAQPDPAGDHPAMAPGASPPEEPSEGRLASHLAEKPLDWSGHLDAAIRLLEGASENGIEEEVRLRMLYMAAARYDAAVRAIASLPPAEQEFWTAGFHGFSTLLDAERNPDAPSRTAEAKHVLAEATAALGELAPLIVRNLAFCTRVHSYGSFEPFPTYEFVPEQRVLLYAEVDNFTSESTAKGYHTSLRSSYQIFDARGQRVADEELAQTEEVCRNRRRDFFIVYDFHLPQRIFPGKHTLRLTIEDLKGQKIGESSIDLVIVSESRP